MAAPAVDASRSNAQPFDVPLEECFPLGEASNRWPAIDGGRRPSRSSVWRYVKAGFAGVKLRTLRVPGVGLVTHPRWIADFVARVNAAGVGSS